ncbi:MAG TPA: DNA recombination protein RmuC [Thermoanaerobaculia bacterium]|jgi:DNA recombination protein RmuC|nr:DNA recombination protein RmuC [Thermoanaerobaculia bacterium]
MSASVLIPLAIVLALGLAAAVAALIGQRGRSGRESAGRFDALLAETARAREASQSVDRRFDELRRAVETRVGSVEERLSASQQSVADHLGTVAQRLTAGQQSVAEHLGRSGQVMRELGERLGRLQEASQKIEKLAGEVTRLEDLLKPPKLRGTLGEMFLEQALSQALPPGAFATQYPLGDGAIVDAVVFIQERVVAIDSKFPLENFRRARELEDDGDRRRARAQFARDVKKHVDAIADKYIRPASGTCDFAFMYVPAEAVYAEIVSDGEEGAVADYATSRRVIPVSPRLLYAYLSTVALGLRGLELQENAREVHQNLADLARLCDRVGGPLEKLGGHLGNAQKQYEETARAFDRFANRLSTISEKAEDRIDSGDPSERVGLPPS